MDHKFSIIGVFVSMIIAFVLWMGLLMDPNVSKDIALWVIGIADLFMVINVICYIGS